MTFVFGILVSGLGIVVTQAAEEETASERVPKASNADVHTLKVLPVTAIPRSLRALQLVQDRMVNGNIKAVDAQRAILEQMMATLETREGTAGLTEKDVAQFLPMILLNGGDPDRVRAILGQSGIVSKDPFLLGSLAYAEGRSNEALIAFATVEVADLPPVSRGQFYLTVGVLQADSQPEKALLNFIKAQLTAPGTLIEEAALRREALLVLATPERFLPLVRSYLHRFSGSPFASAFISQFAFSIGDLDEAVQTQITAELDGLLAKAQSQDRQNFYAILARASLLGSNHVLTDYATKRALTVVTNPSQLLSARLYRAAFDIAGVNHAQAVVELQSLTRVPLQPSDREILAAAISVAQELRRWPVDAAQLAGAVGVGIQGPLIAVPSAEEASNGIKEAQKLLGDTAELTGASK